LDAKKTRGGNGKRVLGPVYPRGGKGLTGKGGFTVDMGKGGGKGPVKVGTRVSSSNVKLDAGVRGGRKGGLSGRGTPERRGGGKSQWSLHRRRWSVTWTRRKKDKNTDKEESTGKKSTQFVSRRDGSERRGKPSGEGLCKKACGTCARGRESRKGTRKNGGGRSFSPTDILPHLGPIKKQRNRGSKDLGRGSKTKKKRKSTKTKKVFKRE